MCFFNLVVHPGEMIGFFMSIRILLKSVFKWDQIKNKLWLHQLWCIWLTRWASVSKVPFPVNLVRLDIVGNMAVWSHDIIPGCSAHFLINSNCVFCLDEAQADVRQNFQIPFWAPTGCVSGRPWSGGWGAEGRGCGPSESEHGVLEGVQRHERPFHWPYLSVSSLGPCGCPCVRTRTCFSSYMCRCAPVSWSAHCLMLLYL